MKKFILIALMCIALMCIVASIILYNPLIDYLAKQSAKPEGFIGKIFTQIWSSYFDDLSKWTIENTKIEENFKILEVGYGGGVNIKNLAESNKDLIIYGADISEESYKTASKLNKTFIDNGEVILSIEDVAEMTYQDNSFDLVFAIQNHMYWAETKKGFEEIYRVMSDNSVLIISSEKDKIDYHMDNYKTTESLTALLKSIGFADVTAKETENWILYTVYKTDSNTPTE